MKAKTVTSSLLVTTAIVVGAAMWGSGWQSAEDPGPATGRVTRRDFSSSVLATGAVKPQVGAEVRVGSRISGTLERLHAHIGDVVRQGQVIAELQKDDLLEAVARNLADVEVAQARIADAEARLRLAELDLQRQTGLFVRDLASQQALDTVIRGAEVSRAGLRLAKAQLDVALIAVREAEVRLSYATISAPISGIVASVSTQEGETVAAGLSAPTFVTIIDLERLQVDAFVDEVDIGKVKVGQNAIFGVDSFPDKEFEGTVAAIYPQAVIQDNVVNYDVLIEILTPYDGLLRPDMTVSLTILMETRPGVLAVPLQATKHVQGKTIVYVLAGGDRVEPREVRVGWRDGQWVEIVEGLEEGETVLLSAPEPGGMG